MLNIESIDLVIKIPMIEKTEKKKKKIFLNLSNLYKLNLEIANGRIMPNQHAV